MNRARNMLGWTRTRWARAMGTRSFRRGWAVAGFAVLAVAAAAGAMFATPSVGTASLPPPFSHLSDVVRPADALVPEGTAGFTLYRNRAVGLAFHHPASWETEEMLGPSRRTVIRDSDGGNLLGGVALVLHPAERMTADQVLDHLMPELRGVAGAREVSRNDGRLANGTTARRLLYTFDQGTGGQGTGLLLAAVEEERAVVVNVMARGGSLLDGGDDVDRFLDSVRLEPNSPSRGNPNRWGWTTYSTVTMGLGSDFVTGMARDSKGHVWFSTWGGGLTVFDGNVWTRFGRPGFGPPDQRALAVMVDSEDRVWVGTDSAGVAVFDGRTWETHDINGSSQANDQVHVLHEDSSGRIWAGTWGGGVGVFDGETWRAYTARESRLTEDRVRVIIEDGENRLWFGTWGGGINVFTPAESLREEGQWEVYTRTNTGLASNRISALLRDSQGAMWVGTHGGGLSRFDGAEWTTWTTADGDLPDDFILSLVEEEEGKLRVGTRSHGVIAFTLDEGVVAFADPLSGVADGLEAPQIEGLLYDDDGRLWAASYGGGVLVWDGDEVITHTEANTGLIHDDVQDLVWDEDGRLWMATLGGVAVLDHGEWQTYTTENSDLPSNEVLQLLIDDEGRVWAATWGGGTVFFDGEEWQRPTGRTGTGITTALAQDGNGNIWEARLAGLFLELSVLSAFDGESWTVHDTATGFFGEAAILDLAVDRSGSVWATTLNRGIKAYTGGEPVTYNTRNSRLPSDTVLSVAEDRQGRIWAGTLEGLSVFDGQVWSSYTPQDSPLPQDLILSITPMAAGVFLGMGRTGAIHFDGKTWLTFDRRSGGLGSNEMNGVFAGPNGNLWFATAGGGVSRYGGPGLVLGLVPDEVREMASGANRQPGRGDPY